MSSGTGAQIKAALALLRGDPAADRAVPPSGTTGYLTTLAAAAMALMMVLALALAMAADRTAARWSGALSGISTLEIPAQGEERARLSARAVQILEETPGIREARPLDDADIRALLLPWLGDSAGLSAEDLPLLLAIDETDALDRAALSTRLAGEIPEAIYHRHDPWAARVTAAASSLRLLSAGFALIALAVSGIVVTLAARAALAINAPVLETLRLIGARDAYIARAFVRRFTLRVLTGAAIGTALGLVLIRSLSASASEIFGALLPQSAGGWAVLALVPLACALLAFLATRNAALRVLRRLR